MSSFLNCKKTTELLPKVWIAINLLTISSVKSYQKVSFPGNICDNICLDISVAWGENKDVMCTLCFSYQKIKDQKSLYTAQMSPYYMTICQQCESEGSINVNCLHGYVWLVD